MKNELSRLKRENALLRNRLVMLMKNNQRLSALSVRLKGTK